MAIYGTVYSDIITGTSASDWIEAFDGNDSVDGGSGADQIYGGFGDDRLWGSTGDDSLFGEAGGDALSGGEGNDFLDGGGGDDSLVGGVGDDTLSGGLGDDDYYIDSANDVLIEIAGEGTDYLYATVSYALAANVSVEYVYASGTAAVDLTGNEFDNWFIGNTGRNILSGGVGNDTLDGKAADDTLLGGVGNDALWGGDGNDIVYGGDGDDTIKGGIGNNVMNGGIGDDYYEITSATDIVAEATAEGNDLVLTFVSYALQTNASIETIRAANNTSLINITGNELDNKIDGNSANNILNGAEGNDRISAGRGNDVITGGSGADIFVFGSTGSANADQITDFVSGTDRIQFNGTAFLLQYGALSASAFVVGSAALDADDRIVYDQPTGQLFYDADGNGSGAAQLFATITSGVTLSNTDFFV